MNIYTVEFKGVWPVGSCLVILAETKGEAEVIAAETITHTKVFTVTERPSNKPGVVVYLSGDY